MANVHKHKENNEMNRIIQTASLVIAIALIGCSPASDAGKGVQKSDPTVETISLQCSKKSLTDSYSFGMGKTASKQEADINFYFDADDCFQGALFGQDDGKGYIFPVGHKTWDKLPLDGVPQVMPESVVGLWPMVKDKEGLAFWVKTKNDRHALVRIKRVQPATFQDLASGKTAELELEWTWANPDKGSR